MIDFRYHLVSLIAVFLAVALGVIIGTTALNDPISADIETRVQQLEQDKRVLEDQTQALNAQLEAGDGFEEAIAPALVAGTLADAGVLVVTTGEDVPDDLVEQVTALVVAAGGTVTGVIRLLPAYSDPATAAGLRTYVTSPGIPAGVQLPTTDDAGQLVAALLAQSLAVPEPGAAPPDAAATSAVVAGLAALEVLTVESSSVTPADYAIVLTGSSGDGDDAAERTQTLVELVTALDAAGSGAVVAGTAASAAETGLVAAIRDDPELAAAVSTVDNVDRAAGRISTVLALGQESEGTSGMYGTGEDTQPVPPVPAPAAP